MSRPLRVLSLFDSTGTWASFAPPGAEVYAVDMQPRPLEWSRARGVVHVQARIKPDPLDGEEIRFEPGDLTVRDAVKRWPRPDVVLMAPPCQALSNLRHVRTVNGGKATPGRESMTTDEGLALVRWCVEYATAVQPRVWCLENPARSLAWTVAERRQVLLWGWFGYPAEKPTGLAGDFEAVPSPFPLPEIDPTGGLLPNGEPRRPCALRPGVGGVQAMPSYLRSRTPPDFARAWWAAQLPRLTQE